MVAKKKCNHHHHHHHWHWSLSCLAYGSDKSNFKWYNIVRFCFRIIIIIIIISFIYVNLFPKLHLKYKVPMYVKEVCSIIWMDSAKVRKKPCYPFSVVHVMTLRFCSSLQTSSRPFPHPVLRTWVMYQLLGREITNSAFP